MPHGVHRAHNEEICGGALDAGIVEVPGQAEHKGQQQTRLCRLQRYIERIRTQPAKFEAFFVIKGLKSG